MADLSFRMRLQTLVPVSTSPMFLYRRTVRRSQILHARMGPTSLSVITVFQVILLRWTLLSFMQKKKQRNNVIVRLIISLPCSQPLLFCEWRRWMQELTIQYGKVLILSSVSSISRTCHGDVMTTENSARSIRNEKTGRNSLPNIWRRGLLWWHGRHVSKNIHV